MNIRQENHWFKLNQIANSKQTWKMESSDIHFKNWSFRKIGLFDVDKKQNS